MRFEGKHQYFKKLARNICNFKNVCYTLAKRHQLRQCWELSSLDVLHQNTYTESERLLPFKSVTPEVQQGIRDKCGVEDIPAEEHLAVVNALKHNNTKYTINNIIIIDVVEEDIPIFMKIAKIIQFRGTWLIFGKLYTPLQFNSHYHAFAVEDQRKWVVVKPGEEKDYHAVDMYDNDDDTFITLHHAVQK